ncbi:MAG: stress response serine/threonine protein kinase YihE [Bdellovibrionales bacterium GWB1_55_8]|nr:MAG: stress response serine/threonine protein kinase YihE [Bdellovibrionales bacterium GWB1_55_8]
MTENKSGWGTGATRFFFELTPERVLDAVEAGGSGLRCTGRCSALNSFENRVYDVEIEVDAPAPLNRRIAKFYRPGRWNFEQVAEEHEFLLDLQAAEIPVVAPVAFPGGETIRETPNGIYYSLFPKVSGRAPDELTPDQLKWIGRLLGRVHSVGAARTAVHRLKLDPSSYARADLDFLLTSAGIPMDLERRFENVGRAIIDLSQPLFEKCVFQRIHGDCHLGNLLWNAQGPFFLDFDDMVVGPPVQDVWLLTPGRDERGIRDRDLLLEGYAQMREFDDSSLKLIEPLRALRFIHYAAWIAKRWEDPAFPRAFPDFGAHRYWQQVTIDLEEQLRLIA